MFDFPKRDIVVSDASGGSNNNTADLCVWTDRKPLLAKSNNMYNYYYRVRRGGGRKDRLGVVSTTAVKAADKPNRKLEKQKESCRLNEYNRGEG